MIKNVILFPTIHMGKGRGTDMATGFSLSLFYYNEKRWILIVRRKIYQFFQNIKL